MSAPEIKELLPPGWTPAMVALMAANAGVSFAEMLKAITTKNKPTYAPWSAARPADCAADFWI